MDNDKLMKLILGPSSNLGAYYKILEQQEKLRKIYSPAITMNNSIQQIVKYYEVFDKINKRIELPLTTSETIRKLIEHTNEISLKYTKYYNQLNSIVGILNPSLYGFIQKNSSSNFTQADTINDIDLTYINSFDAVKDNYDDSVQDELDTLKENFETNDDFKNEITTLLENGTKNISTDVYIAFSQLIERYVGKLTSPSIALFLNFIIITYTILIPLYQIKLGNETEQRIDLKIEKAEDLIINSVDNKVEKVIEKSDDQFKNANAKLDSINDKIDKLTNKKTN
ncbi:MAG: hypothetical protein NTY07_04380 [Bacteroidia bacterium]|nr:hypothetical protein [Bacteroidia bacterium]